MSMQPLEIRRLLSSVAPTAIGSLVFDCVVTDGTGMFADSGELSFSTGSFDSAFEMDYLSAPDLEGTVASYHRLSVETGRVTLTSTELDGPATLDFTFTDALVGTWRLEASNQDFQEGTFEITGSGTVIELISGGRPYVYSTNGHDKIDVSVSEGTITVVRNNWTTTFPLGAASEIVVTGGQGDDRITVTTPETVIDGLDLINVGSNEGNDDVTLFGATPAMVAGGLDSDSIIGGSGNDTLSGNAGVDTIKGGAGDDRLNGHAGFDRLYGQAGNDRVYGHDGRDRLEGGGNVDRLWGGEDADTLVGGGSNDKLYGEAGNDRFYGNAGSDLVNGGSGTDTSDDDAEDSRTSIEVVV